MTPSELVAAALKEDLGRGDLFARCVEAKKASATILSKDEGVLAGRIYADELAKQMGIALLWQKNDGDLLVRGEVIARVEGMQTALLAAERTLLNLLQHASGIATNARRYERRLEGYKTVLLDTRKTRPGLREFEKYAARIGGCRNHRMGLDDCLMIKDTHRAIVGDLALFVQRARQQIPFTAMIEIECSSVAEACVAMTLGAQIVMCDNMTPAEVAQVVAWRDAHAPGVLLEASGNITIENLETYAQTGVDAISSGSIIHQATWLDLSMRMDES
ncbi:MAG: carboxylating nicotinate-nucleotide diphosphorylase [Campylobacterales bacterium]